METNESGWLLLFPTAFLCGLDIHNALLIEHAESLWNTKPLIYSDLSRGSVLIFIAHSESASRLYL